MNIKTKQLFLHVEQMQEVEVFKESFKGNGMDKVINHAGGIVSYRGEIERAM